MEQARQVREILWGHPARDVHSGETRGTLRSDRPYEQPKIKGIRS